ncbi:phosphotransferase [Microbacterium sp. A93]|uniref:phosphotransferase n=1 Tax=Microbacterium sp. A93 TaxID=3450716 RepID=UPI003F42D91F
MSITPNLYEVRVLAEALGVSAESVTVHSREPLGTGSVTGLQVDAEESLHYFVDTSGLSVAAETGLADAVESPSTRIWLHPADPHLPALAPVAFDDAARTLLDRLGITAIGKPEFIGYRPGRRAVLRVPIIDGAVWIKVVRPSRVQRIVRAHEAAASAGIRVPEIHGWSDEGLLVMASASGTPAADVDWDPGALLDQVDALREQFAAVDWDAPARSAAHRLDWYAGRGDAAVARLVPRTRAILARAAEVGERPRVVVHGDLHFGQLFLEDGISAVIDIDTLGLADPAEDAAAFLSHTIASARLTEAHNRGRVWALADLAAARWAGDQLTLGLTLVHLIGHAMAAGDRGDARASAEIEAAAEALLDARAPSTSESKSPLTDVFDSP